MEEWPEGPACQRRHKVSEGQPIACSVRMSSSLHVVGRVQRAVIIKALSFLHFFEKFTLEKFMRGTRVLAQVGCETAHVLVYNASLGKPTKGGKAKASGAVSTLTFETSGRLVWSGDSKVSWLFWLQ